MKSKKMKIISNILLIIQVIASLAVIYSITLINGIENELRLVGIIIIVLFNALTIFLLKLLSGSKRKFCFILAMILTVLLSIVQVFGAYFVYRTYSSIDSINKDKVTYETDLLVMTTSSMNQASDIIDKTIGIIEDETSIDGNILAKELISEENLESKNTIITYGDFTTMISDLYNEKIDVIAVPNNYVSMFQSVEGFEKVSEETKIIATKSKTYTKAEIENLTGGETLIGQAEITEPFTLLVMGIDSEAESLDKNAAGNGDALMVITFNPKTLNATILSIPRDTYVPIACFAGQKENKITHAGWNGASCMINTIENFTGINMDYYIKINFKGVVKVVDALGGIDVTVPEELDGVCEQDSNRDFGNEQCFTEGYQTLNGEQALAMARHRKTLATGDIQRGLNQQIIIEGILNKIKTITNANQALSLLETISGNMDTNFTTKQLLSFYDIAKAIFATSNTSNPFNMEQLFLSGAGQMIYDESMGLELYNYIYNDSSLAEDVLAMKQNLGLTLAEDSIKQIDFNIEEKYESTIVGKDPDGGTHRYSLLSYYVGSSIDYARSQLSGVNINVNYQTVSPGDGYDDGEIISQSYPEGKRLDLIGSGGITFTVAQIKTPATPTPPVTPPTPTGTCYVTQTHCTGTWTAAATVSDPEKDGSCDVGNILSETNQTDCESSGGWWDE